MKRNRKNVGLWVILIFIFVGLNACHKNGDASPDKKNKQYTLLDADSLRFYIWHINVSDSAKPIPSLKHSIFGWVPVYYWLDDVPKDFKWYSDKLNRKTLAKTGGQLMDTIASFSPLFKGKPKDRYSFIDVKGNVSKQLEGGLKGGFGYDVGGVMDQNSNTHLFVEYVYKGSPAGDKGIKRGDEILAINGNDNMDLTVKANVDRINDDLFKKKNVSLTIKRPSGTTYAVDINRIEFHINPVVFQHIYTVNGKKIGYFVYNSFISVGSGKNGSRAKEEIDTVFAKFKAAGVEELIVDLRYNGGGSVASTQFLDNLIAPASAVGKEMFHYEYNKPLTSFFKSNDKFKSFVSPVKFQQENNNLNLSRVFFITSAHTASAAELTINNLKPYMDVEIVGDTTYGKPVGFFTIPINFVMENKGYSHVADMYSINFESVNSNGVSGYFGGLIPDILYHDYINLRWGKRDPSIVSIFNKIEKGSYIQESDMVRRINRNARKIPSTSQEIMRKIATPKIEHPNQFNGMVDYQKSKKLQEIPSF